MDKPGVQPTPINSVFLSVNGPEKKRKPRRVPSATLFLILYQGPQGGGICIKNPLRLEREDDSSQ